MEKKKTAVPAFLGVAAVWIGSHFGPGFATGAFSVRWYVKYGWVGLVTPLLAMFVTGGVMYYMLEYAREHGTPGYRPFARSCYGEKLGGVVAVLYDVCFLMTMMCAGGLAFSGEGKLLQGFLGINYWTTAIVTILVSAALCLYGSKLLAKSSGYMMYAIVGVVLLITVLALARGDCDVTGAFANSAANAKDSSFLHAILGAMQYGCFQSTIVFNVMSVSDVLKDKREARKAILSGYVITIVLMVCLIFTLFSYTNVFDVCAEALPVMAVLGWGWRLGVAHFAQDTGMLINQMPAYLDVYALGMLGAMAYLRMRRAWEHMRPARRRALSWACVAGFAVGVAVVLAILRAQSTASAAGQRALHLSQMEMRLPLTLVLLGAMLCAAHMPRILQKVLDNRLMRFLSAISMNLYIWHQILSVQMRVAWFPDANTLHITPVQQRAYSLLCFSVAILVAMAATYGLEQPAARAVNAWIKRLGRKRNHEGPQIGNPCPPADSLFVRPQAGRARADREFRRRAGGSDGTDS